MRTSLASRSPRTTFTEIGTTPSRLADDFVSVILSLALRRARHGLGRLARLVIEYRADQIAELCWREILAFDRRGEAAVAIDHGGLQRMSNQPLLGPVLNAE